jgi:chromosomal replication initiator protein
VIDTDGLPERDKWIELRRAWDLALHQLATKVSKVTYEAYIRPTLPLDHVDGRVRLGVDSAFAREWLDKKTSNHIRSALEFQLDTSGLEIEFVVLTKEQRRDLLARTKQSTSQSPDPGPQTVLPLDDEKPVKSKRAARSAKTESTPPIANLPINPEARLKSFVVGPSNRLAHGSACQVAAKPGEVFNPLFLYSGTGLGKTYLLQSIANALAEQHPALCVAYVSGETFAQQYITAIREHATETFRRQYREIDVWLVDDIQFIAGKEHTKEEFFHTFNMLHQSHRQVVFTSDRSPRDLTALDDRLRTRFQSGLIVDITPPELQTRIEILRQRKERAGLDIPDDLLIYIASAVQSNIHTLEGAITKLVAYSSVMDVPVSPELAQRVLEDYFIDKPIRQRTITVDDVIRAVGERFGTRPEVITGPGRHKEVALARHVAMHIARELLPETNTTLLGSAFGGRDHATILHACAKIQTLAAADEDLRQLIASVIQELMGPGLPTDCQQQPAGLLPRRLKTS